MQFAGNDIFNIIDLEHTDNQIAASLKINEESKIFKGHFPGQPVVPGACMLQMVKDVLETSLSASLLLKKADQLKFINMLLPSEGMVKLEISYKICDDGLFKITGKLGSGDVVYFKFQGSFVKA